MGAEKRILVVIDPTSDEQPAFARALWLARKLDAVLELFICDYEHRLAGEPALDPVLVASVRMSVQEDHARRLETLVRKAAEEGVPAAADVRWDAALHEGIIRKIVDCDPRFVVKDTHFHSVLKRSLFSNTDWNLIRECSVPLWLVKPRALGAHPKFLAAVDPLHAHDEPAELDHHILGLAQKLCAATGGDLDVFHAFDMAPFVAVAADPVALPVTFPGDDAIADLRRSHVDAVNALAAAHGIPDSKVRVVDGATREALIATVEDRGADVVVMGAVSRSRLKRLILGSTAERVLDALPCDVVIVKPRAIPDAGS